MDLTALRKQLEGKRIMIPRSEVTVYQTNLARKIEFTIERVYPHHLTCYMITENGVFHRESLDIGTLITMGVITKIGKSFRLNRQELCL